MNSGKRQRATKDASSQSHRKTATVEGRPSKKLKTSHEASSTRSNQRAKKQIKDEDSGNIQPKGVSVLGGDETAFPRGGASVLTPLEHKQIKIEAQRDVLFEQAGHRSAGRTSEDAKDEGGDDEEEEGNKSLPSTARKSRPVSKKKKDVVGSESKDKGVRIEGLSYKRVIPGSLILGQISHITSYDMALALPNNLTGYIPMTAISDHLTSKIERLAGRADNDEGSEDSSLDEDISLNKYFSVGQYLRAYVTSAGVDAPEYARVKGKRRIDLSINPRQVNAGLSKSSDVATHSMIQASVVSVEDHGLIMDLGLDDSSVKGFLSTKETGSSVDFRKIEPGTVFMCLVLGQNPNGKIIKLSADLQKAGNIKKSRYVNDAPTVDAILPGTAVEVLLEEVTQSGITGKVMGMLDVTADQFHCGATSKEKDIEKSLKPGQKVKGRIICTFPTSEQRKLGVSLLDHVCSFSTVVAVKNGEKMDPLEALPLSTIVEDATVVKVMSSVGLILDFGMKGVLGFVHISAVSDKRVESLSPSIGPYKIGSKHRSRITGYNPVDGLYIASMEEHILSQPFLRIEDIEIGEVVKGKVEKLVVNEAGVGGILVNLAQGITGLVPEMHIADVKLSHPEKKFKEGMPVTARVLSTNPEKRQLRLTMKKTLVNSDSPILVSYDAVSLDAQYLGTIVNIIPAGAFVQFYGPARAFLPVSEMSQAYIEDPSKHFRIGQVVNVRVISVDPASQKMVVSCKDPAEFGSERQLALQNLKVGSTVNGTVIEKSNDDMTIELEGSKLTAILSLGHLTDGSDRKSLRALKEIRVGQTLKDLVVWEKRENKRLVMLTNKPSIRTAAMSGKLLTAFEDVREGEVVVGIVKNIIATGVFVQFAGGLTGLILKRHLPVEAILLPDFGLKLFQPIPVVVSSVDYEQRRFLLRMEDVEDGKSTSAHAQDAATSNAGHSVVNPVDSSIKSLLDFSIGKITKARITSVKSTQINVQLAGQVQGRIHVSQAFDSWEEISDKKRPLQKFRTKEVISVRILGVHDARNHRFLPISHRTGKNSVFELSAKASDLASPEVNILTLDKVTVGSSWLAYINNIEEDHVWASLSPNVRGRIRLLDLSDEVSLLNGLERHFPVGSALQVRVTNVNLGSNQLDLSALSTKASEAVTFERLSKGMVIPGRITKVTERLVLVQLSECLAGTVGLTEISDNYEEVNLSSFHKNEVVRVCITEIDVPNKRLYLSLRPSRVLSSSLPVKDPEISSLSQLKVNDVVRGFVKNVADHGLFVTLGPHVTSYTRVSDLSDDFIKDWKAGFQVDQLVQGKVITVDPTLNHVQISLKRSLLDKNYTPPITYNDLQVGQVITGKIRKVEDFGVFIVVDGSANVSGLCHRNQIADRKVEDVKRLYQEGDAVKAKVLKNDVEKKRVAFGLKASYFKDLDGDENTDDDDDMESDVAAGDTADESEDVEMENAGVDLSQVQDIDDALEAERELLNEVETSPKVAKTSPTRGLETAGFDWTASVIDMANEGTMHGSEDETGDIKPKKKKKRRAEIKIDRTGELDANGPQSAADFERLLLGQPDSSYLWLQYMAYHLQLSEVDRARAIAERALRTISITEETEKMNVWIGMLNLENAYGTEETLEEVFRRACQYNDPQEIHERLSSIYIQSGKYDQADALFQSSLHKFSQSPSLWLNYATFLMTTLNSPDRARALLARATQSLPSYTHLDLTSKFAQLEFRSANGDAERGRTLFEGLVSTWPKRLDFWNVLLDLEIKRGGGDDGTKERVRALFERVLAKKLKPKKARWFFKRWLAFEEQHGGDEGALEKVRARAARYVVEWKADGEEEGEAEG